MLAKGYHYINLAPEELAKWNKLVNPVKRQYAESLDAKGLPGTKVLEALGSLYSKMTFIEFYHLRVGVVCRIRQMAPALYA